MVRVFQLFVSYSQLHDMGTMACKSFLEKSGFISKVPMFSTFQSSVHATNTRILCIPISLAVPFWSGLLSVVQCKMDGRIYLFPVENSTRILR